MSTLSASAGHSVFLSYARKDGSPFASRLYGDLQEAGYAPWLDVNYLLPGANWAADIEEAISACSSVVAILTRAYIASDICRAEHMRALREGKLVIPLLLDHAADRPLALEHLNYQDFTDAGRYPESFRSLLRAFGDQAQGVLPQRFQATYVNAPALPPAYVKRPDELKILRNTIISDDGNRQVALTALEGMGGVGKSALAADLSNDPTVQAAFPDGVIWVTIGRTPGNLVSQLRSVGMVFGDRPEYYETTETSAARLRQVLRGKSALIVLDDVWDRQHVEPFLTSESRCRTLFTSRDRTIALALGAREVRLGTFTKQQAVDLLSEWAGSFDPALPEIAHSVGYLALALKLAGARLRGGMTPGEWLKRFRQSASQMKLGYRAQSAQDDLTACFDLSLDRYEKKEQDLYQSLGIFPEDLRIPMPVVRRLWRQLDSGLTEPQCRELVDDFSRMELLDIDAEDRIGLHDLLQEYALAKLNGRAQVTHGRFLDTYGGAEGQWWKAENDGYFYRYAAHHFLGGGKREDLEQLLLDFRWLYTKLAATEPVAVVEDFDAVASSGDFSLVQSAIRLSAHILIRDRSQLATQLMGRLLGHPSNAIVRLLESTVRYMPQTWLRPLTRSLRGAESALVGTLTGHASGVSSVVLTPDDTVAISGSFDGTVKIWDWRRGVELRTLSAHARQVNSVAISPDGRRIVSGSSDYKVKIWDLESGTATHTFSVDGAVASVTVSDDGNRVTASGVNIVAYAWDLEGGQPVQGAPEPPPSSTRSAISRNGRREVRVSETGELEVWDRSANSLIRTLAGHPSYVYAVAMTLDGKSAITAHDDGTLRVWNLDAADSRHIVDLAQRPSLAAVLPGGRSVASTCPDGAVRIWNTRGEKPLRRLWLKPGPLVSLRPSLTGLYFVGVTWDLRVRAMDRAFGLPLPAPASIWGWVLARLNERCVIGRRMASIAATSPGWTKLAFSSSELNWSALSLWTGRVQPAWGKHRGTVTALAVSANGRYVVSGSEDGALKVWDSRTRKELFTLEGHAGAVVAVNISASGRRIVSAGFADRTVKVWDTRARREIARFTADCAVQSCSLSLLGNRIIVGDVAGQLHSLRLEAGR